MKLSYSFIVPVFNRPDEVNELLQSLSKQTFADPFEVVLVEDGSTIPSEEIVKHYQDKLQISYYFKPNSGPGDSRNYGMQRAKGNYFLILDSDCVLPPQYLTEVDAALHQTYVDCFGGPDAAHASFTVLQKAINYSMTSFLTTGGIRGSKHAINKFQPRSFNMGLSKKAFEATGGFGNVHPGEDPDLTIRLWKAGFETRFFEKAFVYHKRRVSWHKFYKQVYKFGQVRPILNHWHPETQKITYWFPLVFCLGLMVSVVLALIGFWWFLYAYFLYFSLAFFHSLAINKSLGVALYSLAAILVQFYGYGKGFLQSTFKLKVLNKHPQEAFPTLFFRQ